MSTTPWGDIRSRSVSADGRTCCGSCYCTFITVGTACSKHTTPEERAAAEKLITEVSFGDHPFFAMVKK